MSRNPIYTEDSYGPCSNVWGDELYEEDYYDYEEDIANHKKECTLHLQDVYCKICNEY